jgi:hypothetical protein
MVAPTAPAVAAPYPRNRRRVTLPLYQMSFAHLSSFHFSDIGMSSLVVCLAAIGCANYLRPISAIGRLLDQKQLVPLLVTDSF